jgi:N-acetylglucosamine malate deacetylase 1
METCNFRKILVLAPHTDDGEFGCGATMSRLLNLGASVTYVAFSSAEESVPEGMDKDILKREVRAATIILGLSEDGLILYNFPVRHFPQHRQEILENMVKLNQEIKPDLVLLPSPNDTHQDHATIAAEGFRAFKKTTMLGYEVPWNNLSFNTTGFVKISEGDLEQKILALECYKSQKGRSYANEQFIRSLAITRGTQVGTKYAEVFEVIRLVV